MKKLQHACLSLLLVKPIFSLDQVRNHCREKRCRFGCEIALGLPSEATCRVQPGADRICMHFSFNHGARSRSARYFTVSLSIDRTKGGF